MITTKNIKCPYWSKIISNEFKKEYFKNLNNFLILDNKKYEIFPKKDDIYNAFKYTKYNKIKVIIIGQDPYHGSGQAHGLSFSVLNDKLPPSLKNIFKELVFDLKIKFPNNGNLCSWAKQGVLLINTILTVRKGKPQSHKNIGWEIFTNNIIKKLSNEKQDLVFLLWGKNAQSKIDLIDKEKHHILNSSHPSPFSAHKSFFGCKHFSKTNLFLIQKKKKPINWSL